MVRIPIGNERSARVEVRSVGPDAPYRMVVELAGLELPTHGVDVASHLVPVQEVGDHPGVISGLASPARRRLDST